MLIFSNNIFSYSLSCLPFKEIRCCRMQIIESSNMSYVLVL